MHVSPLLRKHQGGHTLIEMLVALTAGSLTLAAGVSFFSFQIMSLRSENARRTAQMTARGAQIFIVRHLEHIGRDPNGSLFTAATPALQVAEAGRIHYLTNLSDDPTDNDTTDSWEDVVFEYDAGSAAVVVSDGENTHALTDDGATQKSYVPAGGLVFTYFDKDGNEVAPGGGAAARASIRRINVALTVRGVLPIGYLEPEGILSQDVFLPNIS